MWLITALRLGSKLVGSVNVAEVGMSPGFKKAADHFLKSINPKVDPCTDFYEFACGNWHAYNQIPADLASYGHFAAIREKVTKEMRDLLNSHETSTSRAINNLRQIYHGCMDTEKLEEVRGTELVKAIKEMNHWPIVFNETWDPSFYNLTDLLIYLGNSRAMDVFFDLYISPDQRNVSVRLIHIDQGTLGLGSNARDYYLDGKRYAKQLAAYEKYITDKVLLIAEDAGIYKTADMIADEVREIMDFERRLAKIMVSENERRNYTKLYNLHKYSDLQKLLPNVDWDYYFRSLMPYDLHYYLNENPNIIVNEVDYFKRLSVLLEKTDKRILTNYIIWRYTSAWSFQLDKRYDDIQQNFLKAMIGKQVKSPRWKDCGTAASGRMNYASGALYVREYFDKSDKAAALEMIDDLHAAFRDLLLTNDWMDNNTRHYALQKELKMQSLIGYPDFLFDDAELDAYYEKLHLEPNDSYATMVQKTSKWAQNKNFYRLVEPVDRTEFGISSATVNAFYSSLKNGITFPAAILQSPLFDRSFPKAVNYGGIGAVIGHEITHGFDDQGSQFDSEGNLYDWWDTATKERFTERTKCIVDQYSSYEVPGTGLHINGLHTQGENIADNGGVKEAYKAYKRYLEKLGHEEKRLPGLEVYTNDQIFFLSYAQTWCGKTRPEAQIRQILTDPHSPLRFRVNGVVINQPEFAHAFNCPRGAPMNPEHRCVLW
uniref:Neprilysin-1 n=1 Tax=Syphacia muris TaxID=451379 RepID=A0A0N5AT03_9BILA